MNQANSVFTALPLALGLALALAGCASHPSETVREMNRALDESTPAKASEPPAEVSAALLPPININVTGADAADTEPRFDVRVRGVPARDFFLSLVDGTPYNIVVPPDLGGSITLDLKNVTVPEVMEIVRRTYGHEYDRNPRGFEVLPERLTTRIYYVNYLDVKRAGQSSMSAAPGEVTMARSAGSSTGAGTGQNAPATTTATTHGSYSRINTDSSTDLWAGLGDSLRQLIGAGEGRSITVNSQSGVIVARAMPSELRAMGDFLAAMQGMVQRQVILEARILEVELADGFQSGINWGSLRPASDGTVTSGQFGGGSVFNSANGLSNLQGQSNALNPNNFPGIRSNVANAFGGVFAMALDTTNFTAFIELLKTQGEVQVLSSPRVSTVNNQKAVIKVGSDEFFVTGVDSSYTTVNNVAVPQVDVELTPFFSGVALDVTPQISREGDIVLHVHPSVSEVNEQTKNITALGTAFTLPTAASTIRESDSVVRAHNAQIVVIGGLMQTRQQDEEAGVPWLSEIPVLGNLFKHTRKQKRKSELVILIKPVIVDSAETWGDQVQRSSATIRKLGQE